ncbi:gamma-butyrobetaine hydroxylase-like domain-containing protein [Burkholderia sp. IMCC1007]|uniref:gamma-butyrobetaine hydroxylase-like domain-containing protein n=1 Tax=Burkholderia sp. IMCC1007 TaxID=3004104 RepID=UPI0022B3B5C9|nr:gamma-butyrobetaine hydroxylase-like domain-containing protein [Burkholderia sp. IMCC1007]
MIAPTEILLDHAARALTLRWPAGDTQRIDYAQLRSECPCAACRKIRFDGGSVRAQAGLTLDGVEAAGYGIRLLFGDGHARGIYPWPYLAELGEDRLDTGIASHCAHAHRKPAG